MKTYHQNIKAHILKIKKEEISALGKAKKIFVDFGHYDLTNDEKSLHEIWYTCVTKVD